MYVIIRLLILGAVHMTNKMYNGFLLKIASFQLFE